MEKYIEVLTIEGEGLDATYSVERKATVTDMSQAEIQAAAAAIKVQMQQGQEIMLHICRNAEREPCTVEPL